MDGLLIALIVSTLNTLCTSIIRLSSPRVISDRLFMPDFTYYIVCLICQCVTLRLWQLIKKSLKNELFSSLQNLRERIQEIFGQLTFEQVISVSSYNFILEALFYAVSY